MSSEISLCENGLKFTQFFQSTCKNLSDYFSALNKKHRFKLTFVGNLVFLEYCLFLGGGILLSLFSSSFFLPTSH